MYPKIILIKILTESYNLILRQWPLEGNYTFQKIYFLFLSLPFSQVINSPYDHSCLFLSHTNISEDNLTSLPWFSHIHKHTHEHTPTHTMIWWKPTTVSVLAHVWCPPSMIHYAAVQLEMKHAVCHFSLSSLSGEWLDFCCCMYLCVCVYY